MHELLNALNSTAFTLFGADTTWAEVFGFVTGGLCVWYTVKANVVNFPLSMVNAIFFMILFFDAQLYADAWLQVVFFTLSAWGWIVWLKFGPNHDKRPIESAPRWLIGCVILGIGTFTYLFRPVLESHGDPYPTLDALTTGLSLGAQFLLSLKYLQNWYFWIIADLFYIPLYQAKGLTLTAIIYTVFLGLCLAGITQWKAAKVVANA